MSAPDLRQRLQDALARSGGASSDFDLNKDVTVPSTTLTPAAVLIGIRAETETIILTKRSARLKHHPGQIAFPGGKQDPTDPTLIDAALREAHEEIGLPPALVDVLGTLPPHQTVTGYQVTPVVAIIRGDYVPTPEAGEVSEIFEVPFSHLMMPEMYRVEGRRWQGRRRLYFTVPYGPYYIWGATARILRAFAERMS
ncbi:MAG: CoA pyrophosphatase [Yoonia sp.]|uniref:CoA pyrophosphatase n=1 Tax=Yoonia sp. TaxID=2212373 RepID=UPI00273E077C|nr:CoA pyrophosphatase [Yoonia sp.]MDP5086732.1 CoA pyrophosphatase [Yoonia sp.]MDP5362236.1 CoA pyrophosphatase [Paracoccaceae bacterium]